jgi:integral membrane protein
VRGTVLRYRVMAYITGVMLVILCFAGIPLQIAGYPALAHVAGFVHGILYMIYVVTAALLAWKLRLAIVPTLLVLLAGIIPILTFVVERWMTRRYINPALAAETTADRERPLLHRAP